MKPVCVITGGGSGMGLAAARILGKDYRIVVSGRNVAKLKIATNELTDLGIEALGISCDISDRQSVDSLAERASDLGPVAVVLNAAGIAPQASTPLDILRINALGTVHIHDAFHPRMQPGGCLIDVGSTGGYMVHPLVLPTRAYRLSSKDPELLLRKLVARTKWFPRSVRPGFAYCISKNFVIWYVATEAERFASRGLRVLSVSPGSFDTEMGMRAKAGADRLVEFCAIRRYGRVDEIAHLLAFCADPRLSYLTGVDILCDGGCLAGCRKDPLGFLRMQMDFVGNGV